MSLIIYLDPPISHEASEFSTAWFSIPLSFPPGLTKISLGSGFPDIDYRANVISYTFSTYVT